MARKHASRARMPARDSRIPARDSLSNLAASLGSGKDKAAGDAFFLADLARDQIEAMYRGDWLARKIVDIVPYDCIREWREWAGEREAVQRIERTERQLGLRKAVQRAMVLGRLYGGGAILIGTAESDPAALAAPLHPEAIGPGGVRFLHVVSRWQLNALAVVQDPLDPYFGEPSAYGLVAADRGELLLHPSRVIRFFGNPLPDPALYGAQLWSDSVLQSLYDAVHAVAVTGAGATSLVHEAKVDIVTVPNLSEHLSNAATTAQLSARFGYAAAMKSINNLLLLGDGESWSRQTVDFSGLPEMVRTFLQVAAGAADIPVTRLLGQSPAGLSATGDSDTRNYYDMISSRQELDLRPQLERLDGLLLRSAGVEPGSLGFTFRPLWQLSAAEKAGVALQKAQTTAIYAGLQLWPAATTAALVRSQLVEDGTYPGAVAAFEAAGDVSGAQRTVADFDPAQPRDDQGRWTNGGVGSGSPGAEPASASKPAPAEHGSGVGTLGAVLSQFNPVSSALAEEAHPTKAAPLVVATHIHEDPINPEPPEDEQEKQTQERLKELDDPIRGGPRGRPDGTLAVPTPMPTTGKVNPGQNENAISSGLYSGRKFTPEETAGLRELFKGGGAKGSLEGARRLLGKVDIGEVTLPEEVTSRTLEEYARVAEQAIANGQDKLGVQALRLKAIRRILGR